MKDLYSVASEFVDRRLLTESEKYDGGNEFNHLEQAIYASKELENSLRSLQELNPGKYDKYGDTIKKIKEITDEFPPMLDSLKGQMEGESESGEDEEWWDDEEGSEEGDESEGDEGEGFPFEGDEEDGGEEPPFEGQDAIGDDEEF